MLDFGAAVDKIAAAVAAREDPGLMVIARTDSVGANGLEDGIRRAQAFERAGADALFVELKAHANILDDIRRIADAVSIPCTVNVDAGGPLASLQTKDLHRHGIALAIYPALLRNALGFAMREALGHLRDDGNTAAMCARMLSAREYNDCLGLPEVEDWERRFPG